MTTTFNCHTINKRRVASLLIGADVAPGLPEGHLDTFLQASLEVQVYASSTSKRRRRNSDNDPPACLYSGPVVMKGGNSAIKNFRPGTIHVIDVARIKLNEDDVHGDGVHSNVVVVWHDGTVERFDPFLSTKSERSRHMQRFLDDSLSEWLQSVSPRLSYRPFPPDSMPHGPQFIEYMNGHERAVGEQFCYLWCILLVLEVLKGATSVHQGTRNMIRELGLIEVGEDRISSEYSASYLAAIRNLVRRHGLG